MKSWTIVEFVQDGTVEAVPSLWIIRDYCHWPLLSKSRMMKAIKACEGVNTCWPKHAIKHFRNGTFDDYAKARAKAKVAEETSDLQSEVELGPKRKRKIVQTVSDADEESESMMPRPPVLKHRNELGTSSTTVHQTDFDQVLHTPPGLTLRTELGTSSTTVHQTDFNQVQAAQQSTRLISIRCCTRLRGYRTELGTSSTTVHQTDFDQVLHTLPGLTHRTELGTCSRIMDQLDECVQEVSTNSTIIGDGQTHRYLKTIIEQQHLLRCLLTDVSTDVQQIKRILEKNPQQCSSTDEQNSSVFLHIPCPVNSQEEFDELDAFLRAGENAKNVALELANIGGANCASFIKRTLGSLMTDKLAMQFSWLGKKGKRRFDATKLATVIIDAAKISKVSTSVNDTEVCMQKWLRRAAERTKVVTKVY
ncbi:uncharacterized protein LOC143219513 [Lasioglossum baleicum]|uniref:uncharacterized protein LOC143219513 n=1 Tax=Lasioglossum baleicum TaxID=434251 RepID=UPI003FCDE471